jgi:hypothetical protein
MIGLGLGLGLGGRAGGAAATFDPATLALTGWWRASFASSPWTPTASAGTSGSNGNLAEATNPPAVGTALNGYDSADFDGTNDALTSAATIADLINADSYSGWALIRANAIGTSATDAAPYDNDPITTTNAQQHFGLALTTNGGDRIQVYHNDGVSWKTVPSLTISTATPVLVQFRYDGTDIEARIDSGAYQSVAAGNVSAAVLDGDLMVFGGPSFASAFADLNVWEYGVSDQTFSDADFDNVKDYINARYGLAL